MPRKLQITFSFAIGIFFLYIAFKEIKVPDLFNSLLKLNWIYIVALSLMAILSIAIRAWRWQILLLPLKNVSLSRVFNFTMIGFMANNILPAHMGEIVRAYLLGEKEKISKISTFMTVVVERLFDFIILTLFLIITFIYISVPDWLKYGGLFIGISSLVLIILIFILIHSKKKVRIISILLNRLPEKIKKKLEKKVNSFFAGVEILKEKNLILYVLLISVILWLQIGLTIFLVLVGFDFNINLFLVSIFLMVLIAFSITIPSTPGYFGNLQLAFIIGLGLVNITKSNALASSLIYHLTQYIPVTIAGILLFIKEGISFRNILDKTKKDKTKTE